MDPTTQPVSPDEVGGLQSLLGGGMTSVGQPSPPAQSASSNPDAAALQSLLSSADPQVPLFSGRPASSEEFNAAQYAGGYTEPAEKSGRPITYLMQKQGESYSDFMKRAVAHGKTVTRQQISDEADQPKKLALDVPARIAETAGGSIASLTGAAEALSYGGPMAHKALQWVTEWAKNNRTAAGLGLLWAVNKGLEMAGLPKASKIVENMELPAILLLGGSKASEAAAEGAEGVTAEKAATASETSTATRESPEAFVDRQTTGRAQVKPNAEGQTVNATGEPVEQAPREDIDTRSADEKQASLDKYYAKHPDKVPQQKVVQRGPKKGQVKTVRVFDEGQWHEVPVYK